MRLLRIREDVCINLEHVVHVEIEAIKYGAEFVIRWTLLGRTSYCSTRGFKTRDDAVAYLDSLQNESIRGTYR